MSEEINEEIDVEEQFDGDVEGTEEVVEEAPRDIHDSDIPELSDEELDAVADAAIETLQDILSFFDAEGAEINEYEGDERELLLDIVGGDLGVLIGRRGRTLDSLQVLVSAIVRKKLGFRYPVTVDVESYKHRQRQKIESIALSAASRAYRQDREVKLRPMNPYERRLVHMALREDERVETFSVGRDPERFVTIRPI